MSLVTIVAQVVLGLWSEGLIFRGSTPSPTLANLLPWLLFGFALIAVIAIVGPGHERIGLIALLFVVVTVLGTFFVGQFVLFEFQYRRDYSQMAPELTAIRSL
jgi:hypothetical protein